MGAASRHVAATEVALYQRLHHIRFPVTDPHSLDQDKAFFYLREGDVEHSVRFHDYDSIYARVGLYEQLFYQRLRCASPQKARAVLEQVLRDNHMQLSELRVLDLGAGNGMVGELLDAARIVGVDISEAARRACERDRPGTYDAYYVEDLSRSPSPIASELENWQLDCLTCIAALGFGDIPAAAFSNAFNAICTEGWIVFNIKETFLRENDTSGFSLLVKHLLVHDTLEVHHLERYRHRVSIDGRPLFYYLLCGRKKGQIPDQLIAQYAS